MIDRANLRILWKFLGIARRSLIFIVCTSKPTNIMAKLLRLVAVLCVLCFSAVVMAQVPRTISYQGVLAGKSGSPVADGSHTLVLRLYGSRTGKVVLYSKTDTIVTTGGMFSTLLDAISDSLVFDKQLYLGISVDGSTELSPRTPLTSSPYALNPAVSTITLLKSDATINISNPSGPQPTISVATGGITSTKLADAAVTNSKIADGSISSAKVADGAITNAKIATVDWTKITNAPNIGGTSSGAAGGDLIGNYPSPLLKHTGVVAGTYLNANIAVDSAGRLTSAQNGTGGSDSLTLPFTGSSSSAIAFEAKNTKATPNGIGLRGEALSTSSLSNPNGGVVGENLATSIAFPSYGVVGKNSAAATNAAGVYGINTASTAGDGVYGSGFYGVAGVANSTAGSAAIYGSASTSGTYAGYFAGATYTVGTQTATGTKSAVVPINEAKTEWRKLYCEEAAQVYFNDYGSAELHNGRALVMLDPIFIKTVTIDASHPIKVFIEMNGETRGVFVQKRIDGFDVIENNGGNSNAAFDYRVVALRKGYEDVRMEASPGPITNSAVGIR